MRWLAIVLPLVVLAMASPAPAQNPNSVDGRTPAFSVSISPGEVTATPEMWFYEQYLRQRMDPKTAVRERAEFKAAQRDRRIAARKWFGFSNIRPSASADPYNGDYSPVWSSNNASSPYQWNGVGSPLVVVRPGTASTY